MEQLEQKKQKLENTIYKPNHQEHVFKFWSILTENEKKSLLQQLEMIDVAKLNEFYKATMAAEQERKSDKNSISNIHPPKHVFKVKSFADIFTAFLQNRRSKTNKNENYFSMKDSRLSQLEK